MNPLTPLELLDIIEREHGFESPSIRLALERAKKVEELLGLYRIYEQLKEAYTVNDSVLKGQIIVDRLREINEEINIQEKELEELKSGN